MTGLRLILPRFQVSNQKLVFWDYGSGENISYKIIFRETSVTDIGISAICKVLAQNKNI